MLPVGGIKEKVLAARRMGIREVVLPRQNEKNVREDLSEELRRDLTIHLVTTIDDVLRTRAAARAARAPHRGARRRSTRPRTPSPGTRASRPR